MTFNYADRLAEMDDVWSKAEAPSGEHTPVPDGNYQALVDRVEIKESKAGNLMLEWTLKITGPKQAGRLLWRRNMLQSEKNLGFLRKDLAVCGLELAKLSDLPTKLTELLDQLLNIAVKTKGEYQEVYLNERAGNGSTKSRPAHDDSGVPF